MREEEESERDCAMRDRLVTAQLTKTEHILELRHLDALLKLKGFIFSGFLGFHRGMVHETVRADPTF